MNAPDSHSDLTPRDAELLAGIDRALTYPGLVTHEPESLEEFCAHLATMTPTADPVFRDTLEQRLTVALEQRAQRPGVLARFRSLVSPTRRRAKQPQLRAAPRRMRWASLLLAMLVAGGGAGAYLHGQGPTPVDAQTVLHRAAATSPGANEATHATYRLSADGGLTGTADVWIGFDGTGTATQFALTESMSKDGGPVSNLSGGAVLTGQSLLQKYDPTRAPKAPPSADTPDQALEGMLAGTLLAQKLSRQPNAYTLQNTTLDGTPVYALSLDTPIKQTYYFNAQSYVLEGADWVQDGKSWRARLDPASYHTVPLSSVPSGTFPMTVGNGSTVRMHTQAGDAGQSGPVTSGSGPSLTSDSTRGGVSINISGGGPSGSNANLTISVSVAGPTGSSVDLTPALAAACSTTPQAFAAAMTSQTSSRSILAICQQTRAGISADQLVTALLTPVQSTLDGLVRSGTISSAQESADLDNLRTQLAHLVMSGIGIGTSGRPAGSIWQKDGPPGSASTTQQP